MSDGTIEFPTLADLTRGWWWLQIGDAVQPPQWHLGAVYNITRPVFAPWGQEWNEEGFTPLGSMLCLEGDGRRIIVAARPLTAPDGRRVDDEF